MRQPSYPATGSVVIELADGVVFRVRVITTESPSVRCDRRLGHFVEDSLSVHFNGGFSLEANDIQLERGLSSLPRL